ncbi:vasculin [Spea bombifrons]|uniref:vasculin n=1 Tax=Spea bombifrons TaxID=233779 RepID=UPI00234B9751|nr:vasculin [Spea bombifrons]XP_053304015.1 vasculin [Spea bombifrons]
MAQHDFAPAWLSFPTPPSSSTKSSVNTEKPSETAVRQDNRYSVIRRRHNSSDALDASLGRSNGGNFGRKEKNGWRSQSRNGAENINHWGAYNGTGSRSRSSTFHCGKSHREHNSSECDTARKDDRERRKQFEAEDFPSLNPEHEKEVNQNRTISAGVWDFPLNTKSRTSRMLVIRKGMKDDLSLSGYPIATSTRIPPATNETEAPKSIVPKSVTPPRELYSQLDENKLESDICLDPVRESFGPNKSIYDDLLCRDISQSPLKEGVNTSSFHSSIGTCHERDINRNFDTNEVPQSNGNVLTSQQITRASTFSHTDVLSSSLEAEHRLLKEMGWQEDSENDEIYAPLTEAEMREFQSISEQLQKNGLRKNGLLKNCLSLNLKFSPWKNRTFMATDENEESETSSSDTSDDDA